MQNNWKQKDTIYVDWMSILIIIFFLIADIQDLWVFIEQKLGYIASGSSC